MSSKIVRNSVFPQLKTTKMNRYFLVSIFLFFIGIMFILSPKKEKNIFIKEEAAPFCDTTSTLSDYQIFDVVLGLRPQLASTNQTNKIVYFDTDNEGFKTTFSYDKLLDLYQFSADSGAKPKPITLADSIAFKALIVSNPKLFERWAKVLKPFREEFVNKRTRLFALLPNDLPNYDYKVVSDFRLSDNQEQLLKAGKSAAPLSAHQFGLASDIAIKRKGKYLTGYTFYKIMGQQAIKQELTWGGNFVGFVDPGHIQLFDNSAKMLAQIPALRYEFELFRNHYQSRVDKMTKAGKAKSVEDTKELLQIMDMLNEENLCICESKKIVNKADSLALNNKLKVVDYQKDTQLLIYLNKNEKSVIVQLPNQKPKKMALGTWK
jgi:hypothetical protein